jgi:nicotinate phosphoribosyltransferase
MRNGNFLKNKYMGIIRSFIDDDLYKFTMLKFVLDHFSTIEVEYTFIDRSHQIKMTPEAFERLQFEITELSKLILTDGEYNWMADKLYFLPIWFLCYLKSYRYNPNQVILSLDSDNYLICKLKGPWRDTILFEEIGRAHV